MSYGSFMGNEDRKMCLIVEWMSGKNTHGGYSLVSSEDLVDNLPYADYHTGKLVNVEQDTVVRQACIVIASVDKEFLEKEMNHLQGTAQQFSFVRRKSTQQLDNTKSSGSQTFKIQSDEGNFLNSRLDQNPNSSECDSETNIATLHRKRANFKKSNTITRHMIQSSNCGITERIEVTLKKSNANALINIPRPGGSLLFRRNENIPPMTFDQQTQTTVSYNDSQNISILFQNQNQLCSEIRYLRKAIEEFGIKMESMQISIEELINIRYQKQDSEEEHEHECDQDISVLSEADKCEVESNASKKSSSSYYPSPSNTYQARQSSNVEGEASTSDMVPIGRGKTLIPRHVYNQIKWNSYSSATRKLLMSVFPRKILATHSLTGKTSSNKPAKMKLDAKKIADITNTVSQICQVQESLIRNIITAKCFDENRMYQTRVEKMKKKKKRE